ncbi:MAG: hypothetical protein QM478_11645 [Flavobacteriaceae bacterium]
MKIVFLKQFQLMATISSVRRNNLIRLRNLIKEEFNKNLNNQNTRFTDKIFSEMIGLRTTTYAQLKNSKHKPYFNEIYARRIEENLNLEIGWFDEDRDNVDFRLSKINFNKFQIALRAYNNFIVNEKIKIKDEETFDRMEKNLFLHVFKNKISEEFKITENDFYDFLKNKYKIDC